MPAVRFIVTALPIERINGKLANTAIKCPNSDKQEDVYKDGFFYGYTHRNSNRNFFGVRHKCRNLTRNPITPSEDENRILFTLTLNTVNAALLDPIKYGKCDADFKQQREYRTLKGYAIAMVRANGGEWLERWN